VTSLAESISQVITLVVTSPAFFLASSALALLLGASFGVLMTRSTRRTTAIAADVGGGSVFAILYGSFFARMLLTGALFALLVSFYPGEAVWAAAGFAIAIVAGAGSSLVRYASPRLGKGGR
jgi:hypothetical protein